MKRLISNARIDKYDGVRLTKTNTLDRLLQGAAFGRAFRWHLERFRCRDRIRILIDDRASKQHGRLYVFSACGSIDQDVSLRGDGYGYAA